MFTDNNLPNWEDVVRKKAMKEGMREGIKKGMKEGAIGIFVYIIKDCFNEEPSEEIINMLNAMSQKELRQAGKLICLSSSTEEFKSLISQNKNQMHPK